MQRDWQNSRRKFLIPVLMVALGIWVYTLSPVPLTLVQLRNATFDQYQRWHPRVYTSGLQDKPEAESLRLQQCTHKPASVYIADIDEESLKRLGQWPWPRTRVAELVTKLTDAKTAVIAFDVVFAEPDSTSPKAMLKLWHATPDLEQDLAGLPDHDEVFAKAIARGNVVLGFAPKAEGPEVTHPPAKAGYAVKGDSGQVQANVRALINTVRPLPLLESAARGIGAITYFSDSDGVVRKVPLVMRQGDALLPSLSAEVLRLWQGASSYTLRTEEHQGLAEVRIGSLVLPTTREGEVWNYYTKPVPKDCSVSECPEQRRYIPVWKILAGEKLGVDLKDSLVLVGTSAPGLVDLRFNPMGQFMPGVEAHAQFLEQVLSCSGINRPSWTEALEILLMVAGSLLLGFAALTRHVMHSFIVCLTLLAILWLGAWWAFLQLGLLLDLAFPSIVIILSYVLSGIVRHVYSERRQRWVKEAFSRYVSPNLVNHLIGSPHALELGGRRQLCSFVFTDLAGFTSLMESMDPADAVAVLNDYLDGMIKVAFSYQGTLDRIVGDAVAIMFSAPVLQADHQHRALSCALAMHQFAGQYVETLKARGITFAKTRIGVHTGDVIVGNFGGTTIFDYRALGDPVNTASRLEGANKYLGTLICVSEDTLSGCHDLHARPAGRLLLKGKSKPLSVFEPLTPESEGKYDCEAYTIAYELMRTGQAEALSVFEALYAKHPDDPLVALHTQRLRAGVKDDLMVLTEK